MSKPETKKVPSKWWYVGHIFCWVITGLICYILWKEENLKAAKKHLIHSIWIGIIGYVPIIFATAALFAFLPFD